MIITQERRTDCDDFKQRFSESETGCCWTDGHYLCKNCKHIASFENMGEKDNREKFYPELDELQEFQWLIDELKMEMYLSKVAVEEKD